MAVTRPVMVVSDDTDIAVLLLYHWHMDLQSITLNSFISKKIWSIHQAAESLHPDFRNSLLVIHAFSGCDTTSAIFNKGKITICNLFKG